MIVLDGEKPVLGLAFTPDGKQLLVSRAREPVEVRSVPDGELLPSLSAKINVDGSLFVHPGGRVVYIAEPKFAVIPRKGSAKIKHPNLGSVASILFSRDGRFAIVQPNTEKGKLRGFACDAKGNLAAEPTWAVPPFDHCEKLGGLIGDGDQFVTVDSHKLVVRDTATGEVQTTFRYPSYYASCRCTSPDGKWFACEGWNKLYLYNTAKWGKPVRLNTGCASGAMEPLAFHPTRQILMAVLGGATIAKYLNPETGELLKKFRWNIGELWAVCFSPDGALAAAGSASGKIVVWDVDD